MRELSLHVLDIAQNSISAGASLIDIYVFENITADTLEIRVTDNGCGMSAEQLERVRDPFYTTRTSRKVGMGIPLFRMAAEMAGGKLTIQSDPGAGTTVKAGFVRSHIDRMPLGDMCGTVIALIRLNPDLDFRYTYAINDRSFTLDTRELRRVLEDVPLNTPEVAAWMEDFMHEQMDAILSLPDDDRQNTQ